MEGFIVLHRKLLEWGWYDDTNMVRLWLHLLLMANFREKSWHGQIIKRGQLVTGREILAQETGLSVRQVRTCLDRLVECGCITKKTTNRYTLITICKYSDYQDLPEENGQQTTNKRPTNDQQTTTTKQRNKETRYNTHTIHAREEIFDDAWDSEQWREAVCALHKLMPSELENKWKEFLLHRKASDKQNDSIKDIREHFNLWLYGNESTTKGFKDNAGARSATLEVSEEFKSSFDF